METEEPTPEQLRALFEACPKVVTIHYPGPWGSTIIIRIPFGRNRPEPDWEALVSDLAVLGPAAGVGGEVTDHQGIDRDQGHPQD